MNKDSLRIGTKYVFMTRKGEPLHRGTFTGVNEDGRLSFNEDGNTVLVKSGHYVHRVSEDTTEEMVNEALTQADFLARAKELEIIVLLLHKYEIHAGIGAIAPRGANPQPSLFIPYPDAHRLGDLVRDAFFKDYETDKS